MYVVIIILIILGVLLYKNTQQTEKFTLIYDVDIDITPINIINANYDLSEKTMKTLIKTPMITFNKPLDRKTTLSVTDIFTYLSTKPNDSKVMTVVNDKKTLLLVKKRDTYSYETFTEAIKRNKTFRCPTPIHKELLYILCKSYTIDTNTIKIVNDNPDITVYFESLNNNIIRDPDVDFVSYDKFNIHQMKFFLPYSRIKNQSMDTLWKGYKDKFPIKTCICIEMLLWGYNTIHRLPERKMFNTDAENNYVSIFVDFYDKVNKEMESYNKHIDNRSNMQILEQFSNRETIIIIPPHSISGFLKDGKFYMNTTHIDGVPIKTGIQVILEKQWNNWENGKYMAISESVLEKSVVKSDSNKDERCKTNEECPFYQKNKTYNNYFGGCIDGYCDMPIGVKKTGYKTYQGNPYCYGGECSSQNQDYAFELDMFQRLKN